MNSKTQIIVGIILITAFVIGSYFLLNQGSSQTKTITRYIKTDKNKPQIEITKTFTDLGTMKVSEDRSAEFTIKNAGRQPLQLYGISSSCNCTFGQVVIAGKESEFFGMHAVSDLAGEVLAGKEAKIRVIYRPSIMPVYGVVEREVYISTNDPDNPKLTFKVKANVK